MMHDCESLSVTFIDILCTSLRKIVNYALIQCLKFKCDSHHVTTQLVGPIYIRLLFCSSSRCIIHNQQSYQVSHHTADNLSKVSRCHQDPIYFVKRDVSPTCLQKDSLAELSVFACDWPYDISQQRMIILLE